MSKLALEFIELDVSWCSLTYGVAPCAAALGVTGDAKCFQTRATCQDTDNFAGSTVTLRFAKSASYLPREIACIPSIKSIDFSPQIISIGENIGQRASLKVTFSDQRHSDAGDGFDKYIEDRGYDPYQRGTFWGRFRKRQPFLKGAALRWKTGFVGDELADMESRLFIVESFDGPAADGTFSITAKDVLKALEGKTANAPALSNGYLSADLTAIATSLTLLPLGIGNEEYPASGTACIGGNEIVNFTRSGDNITLVDRGVDGTTSVTHKAQDRFQLCARYIAVSPERIIYDLLVTYGGIPASYIPLAAWTAEVENFVGTVYTATIAEPTPVETLVSELLQQAALALWWDDTAQLIRLQALRSIASVGTFDEGNVIKGSFAASDQADKRLSQIWVYFGRINSTKKVDEADNYRSTDISIDEAAEADYGVPAIKKIYSRWIPALGRAVAQRLGALQLARYRSPPRKFSLSVLRDSVDAPLLGAGYSLSWWSLQDPSGAAEVVPISLTRVRAGPDQFALEAEEALFVTPDGDLSNRIVVLDYSQNRVNLRTAHDSLYPGPQSGDVVTCIVEEGAFIGSPSTDIPAFDVGSWPAGVDITVIVRGRIQGAGGAGGNGISVSGGSNGGNGGVALYTRYAINLEVDVGHIWGGGGGGGGSGEGFALGTSAGGGGGAGNLPGNGGLSSAGLPYGDNGTPTAGAFGAATYGVSGGTGGGPGLPGTQGSSTDPAFSYGLGGSPGAAIDGISYINVTVGPGDRRGPEIN